jgi:hypothetical protein
MRVTNQQCPVKGRYIDKCDSLPRTQEAAVHNNSGLALASLVRGGK